MLCEGCQRRTVTTPVAEPPVNVQQGWSCRLTLQLDCPAVILALGVVVVVVAVADLVRGGMPVSRGEISKHIVVQFLNVLVLLAIFTSLCWHHEATGARPLAVTPRNWFWKLIGCFSCAAAFLSVQRPTHSFARQFDASSAPVLFHLQHTRNSTVFRLFRSNLLQVLNQHSNVKSKTNVVCG